MDLYDHVTSSRRAHLQDSFFRIPAESKMLDLSLATGALTDSLNFASLDELDPSLGMLCQPDAVCIAESGACNIGSVYYTSLNTVLALQLKTSSCFVCARLPWRFGHKLATARQKLAASRQCASGCWSDRLSQS